MSFRCPPELLLRNAIRSRTLSSRLQKRNVSSNTYRAATLVELGKPVEVKNVPTESTPPGHVKLAVHACGINFADILTAQGKYQVKPELPFVAGSEVAGEVIEVGEDVDNYKTGDRVFGMATIGGGFAEEIVLPAMSLTPLPKVASYATGASFLVSYCTAYVALTRKAHIKEGETVLVTAAAGGTGLATVDLAANIFKCEVIAACGSDEKCQLTKSRGATHTINYNKESIRQRVKEITGGQGADVIVDMVGGDVWNECTRSVAFEGRLIVIGFASGDVPKLPTNMLLVKSCSAIGLWWGNYGMRGHPAFFESISNISEHLSKKELNPLTGASFPLSKINDAFEYVLARKSTGKVVIEPRK